MKITPLPSVGDVVFESYEKRVYEREEILTHDRDQAYTSLIEGIEGMKITTMAGLRFDEDEKGYNNALKEIINKVIKPLYGKE